ncbi:MAG: dUTP diphosphatase [Deltaproteobacteria bacterium]|nr:dUTP diphosphatase [Deltaproteobacteria bacterium]
MGKLDVMFTFLPHGEGLSAPSYATALSAGLDLVAAITGETVIQPGGRCLIPTGIRLAIPEGYEAQVRPRSGLALKNGILLANSPGTIDADYRGEVKVILLNLGEEPFAVTRGMRIAQMIVAPVARVSLVPAGELPETGRGSGGFGHTGN